jgi:serine/threonine protein kinase
MHPAALAQVSSVPQILGLGLGVLLAVVVAAVLLAYVAVPVARGIYLVISHLITFVWRTFADTARGVGALLLGILYVPMILGCIVIGRWSAAQHYGSALTGELGAAGLCLYRLVIGNPARLFMLQGLTEGLEKRLPAVMAAAPATDLPRNVSGGNAADAYNANTSAPTSDVPMGLLQPAESGSARRGQFDGYVIVGSLPSGGSGAKLYIAEPDPVKAAAFSAAGVSVDQVVIKSFSLVEGSSLPQIVRESRSLDAAKRMGLILDHELGSDKFYYVMRYVPGESLTLITRQLHASSETPAVGTPAGLGAPQLSAAMGYAIDLVATLGAYHQGGLWHKDVKPDNIIVATRGDRRAHLVDFGLVSSLRSAMTLTTHGTEYFRDPELVRRALRGVKVHEVDGTKFDIYAAGAVLYSIIEDSFPAHGVLSQYNKRCPEALKWVIRRAMTDYDKRYATAAQMLTDLQYIARAGDAYMVKPLELPSMRESVQAEETAAQAAQDVSPAGSSDRNVNTPPPLPNAVGGFAGVAATVVGAVAGAAQAAAAAASGAGPDSASGEARRTPRIRVTNWWSGEVVVEGADGREQRPPTNPFATPQGQQVVNAGMAAASTASVAAQQMAAQAIAAAQQAFKAPAGRGARGAKVTPQDTGSPHGGVHGAHPDIGGRDTGGRRPLVDVSQRKPAAEQIAAARARAAAAQARARNRRHSGGSGMKGYKSGPNGGVAIALCALAGTVLGVGAIMATRSAPSPIDSYVVTYGDGAPQLHDGPAMDESAAFETGPESTGGQPQTSLVMSGGCRILLMNDVKQPWSPEQQEWITSLRTRLTDANVTLLGEVPGDAELSDDELSMIASLRVTVGTTPLDGADLPQRICAWQAAQNNGPTEIIWLRQFPRNDTPSTFRFRCKGADACEGVAGILQ